MWRNPAVHCYVVEPGRGIYRPVHRNVNQVLHSGVLRDSCPVSDRGFFVTLVEGCLRDQDTARTTERMRRAMTTKGERLFTVRIRPSAL